MGNYAIETRGLTRIYGRTRALNGLDLAVPKGQLTALLGPNGAGKTTLFSILAGQIAVTEGTAHLLGADTTHAFDSITHRVATLLDLHEPPPWARVKNLLRLEQEAMPIFDAMHARSLIVQQGIALEARYGDLSKGQRRWTRASLALASGAQVILLDEPADGMDAETRRHLYDAMRSLVNDRGATIVVATHIINDIERVADDVALLHKGRLLLHDSLEDLREHVRTVDITGAPPPDGLHDATILRSARDNGTTRLFLRMNNGDSELRRLFGEQIELEPVNLEALYLALTAREPRGVC